jgi:hypothetical protein
MRASDMTGKGPTRNINACSRRQLEVTDIRFLHLLILCGQARGAATRIQLTVLRREVDMHDRGHPSIQTGNGAGRAQF